MERQKCGSIGRNLHVFSQICIDIFQTTTTCTIERGHSIVSGFVTIIPNHLELVVAEFDDNPEEKPPVTNNACERNDMK